MDKYCWLWVFSSWVVPGAIGGLVTRSWTGALGGFLWGGLVRTFLLHHITWSINSVCHVWGTRPFAGPDQSRNNAVFGVLAFGEGWHNNHHAFPTSARHGLRWWQIDMSYWLILLMRPCGLAHNVRVPSPGGAGRHRAPLAPSEPDRLGHDRDRRRPARRAVRMPRCSPSRLTCPRLGRVAPLRLVLGPREHAACDCLSQVLPGTVGRGRMTPAFALVAHWTLSVGRWRVGPPSGRTRPTRRPSPAAFGRLLR